MKPRAPDPTPILKQRRAGNDLHWNTDLMDPDVPSDGSIDEPLVRPDDVDMVVVGVENADVLDVDASPSAVPPGSRADFAEVDIGSAFPMVEDFPLPMFDVAVSPVVVPSGSREGLADVDGEAPLDPNIEPVVAPD